MESDVLSSIFIRQPSSMPADYQLRPETPDDLAFHAEVYASTRLEELDAADFPAEHRETFLAMQFQAQTHHYRTHFPAAEWLIIECDGQRAGRIILDRAADHLHVLDLALLPPYRGRGIGTDVLRKIFAQAGPLPVRLYAHNADRAIKLYLRLGFQPVGDDGMNTELVWRRDELAA